VVGPAHRGQFSGKLEVLLKGEPFPGDVPDCKKNIFGTQSQTPSETLPHGIQLFSKNMDLAQRNQ